MSSTAASTAPPPIPPATGLPPLVSDVDPASTPQAAARTNAAERVRACVAADASVAVTADTDGRTLLHWAAAAPAGCGPDTVLFLLSLPPVAAMVNAGDEEGWTPLHIAAAAGNVDIIRALLASGADADRANGNGQIPLHYAKGRAPVIRAILPATRHPNAVDKAGQTALHRAAGGGHVDAILALVTSGDVDVNVADRHGDTPLHLACEEGRLGAAKALVEHGADVTMRNVAGKTPLDWMPEGATKRAWAAGPAARGGK